MVKKKTKSKSLKSRTKPKKSAPKKKLASKAKAKTAKTGVQRLKPIPGAPPTLVISSPQKKVVGRVVHYFGNIGVGIIELNGGDLALGDEITIEGLHTKVQQKVDSLQFERKPVNIARIGQSVGLKVKDRVRENDVVYKVIRKI